MTAAPGRGARGGTATRRRPPPVWPMRVAALALLALVLGGGYALVGWLAGGPAPEPAATAEGPAGSGASEAAALPDPAGEVAAAPALVPPLRDVEQILAHRSEGVALSRLARLPRVLVLDFPSMAEQAAALNRVAALVEKAGLSRDHVVTRAVLAEYVRARGGSLETFYYGHNYHSADLARFYRLAEAEGRALSLAESALRRLLTDAGALAPGPEGPVAGPAIDYVISLAQMPREGGARLRRTVLEHEVGHAVYARSPDYRAHVLSFWEERMSETERDAFRTFLAKRDYDISDRDLVLDETQAYLHFTPNPDAVSDRMLGLPEGGLADLRARFAEGIPAAASPGP